MKPFVVMRSHNDMPVVSETLLKLSEQSHPFELLCLDNESTDGTVDELKKYSSQIMNIPGRVLNLGMELSTGANFVFLNSDCNTKNGLISLALSSTVVRLAQLLGRRKGFKEGFLERK